jgi:phosphate starvation-inducible PhoH-like protein
MPRFSKQKSYHKPVHDPAYAPVPEAVQVPKINPRSLTVKRVHPKNERQGQLLESIDENDLTFVIGPAGTGKTFTVVHAALMALRDDVVQRIIISRPAVTAGEDLGFLPGSVGEKMDPYLKPMLDAFRSLIGPQALQALRDNYYIEILPFAFMRGMNLSNAFVFLDEFQNATADQMKTALTRIGEGSVCVVAADPEQIDLEDKSLSSIHDMHRFRNVKGIGFTEFLPQDVLRSRIVRTVLGCYQ